MSEDSQGRIARPHLAAEEVRRVTQDDVDPGFERQLPLAPGLPPRTTLPYRVDGPSSGRPDPLVPVAPEEPISVDPEALHHAQERFGHHAEAFHHRIEALGHAYDHLLVGAGETRDDFELGAAEFLLGWRETFQVCAETARIIKHNVGGYVVDLTAEDDELAFDLRPEPRR